MLAELLCLALCGFALLYASLASSFSYWKKRGVSFIKPLPVFGNTLQLALFRKSTSELFQDFYNSNELKNEKFGGIFLGSRPCVLVRDLELIKKIMIKDFQYFSDRGLQFSEKREPLSAHLFNLNGWRWRALRIKLSPTFTSGKMKMMYGIMAECAEGLEKMLEEPARKSMVLEMKEPLAQFTTDIIGTCAFGLQFNSMENPNCKFREMGKKIFEANFKNGLKRIILMNFPAFAKLFGLSFVEKDLSKFFRDAVLDTVKYREENNIVRNDFMQLLIELKNKGYVHDSEGAASNNVIDIVEDGKEKLELTEDLLAAQAFLFFVAGFETSSTTMGFALYELSMNPEIQEKLADEIRTAIGENDDKLNYEIILGMKYLDMVVSETLRKYPPLGNLFRKTVKPYQIEGTQIVLEPNLRVFIPVYAIQRDPKYYPDPEKFIPERFEPKEKAKRDPMSYMPFGDGPRNCIGSRFGLLQTKLGLCTLLKRYSFEICEETPIPPRLEPKNFVALLKGGIVLRITERQ